MIYFMNKKSYQLVLVNEDDEELLEKYANDPEYTQNFQFNGCAC